ncbi:hypothetical protein [Allofournierella massiliensis]|nr:hypothetical protein [Fournierella massiliensis]
MTTFRQVMPRSAVYASFSLQLLIAGLLIRRIFRVLFPVGAVLG